MSRNPLLLIATLLLLIPVGSHAGEPITVYKSPTCGCCGAWIKHMERNGFEVTTYDSDKMSEVKQMLGVKPEHASCHTAEIGGYLIEGHVPAKDIRRLLSERPKVAGLAVPGMPMGSPGMEGKYSEPYQVITFDKQGNTTTFSRY